MNIATQHIHRSQPSRGRGLRAYATDPTRFHEWQKGVLEGHIDDPATASIGNRCLTTRQIGLAKRPVTSEVTHIDPPHTWGIRGIDGPIRAQVNVSVTELDDGRCRVVIDIDFTGHSIGKILVRSSSEAKHERRCRRTSRP